MLQPLGQRRTAVSLFSQGDFSVKKVLLTLILIAGFAVTANCQTIDTFEINDAYVEYDSFGGMTTTDSGLETSWEVTGPAGPTIKLIPEYYIAQTAIVDGIPVTTWQLVGEQYKAFADLDQTLTQFTVPNLPVDQLGKAKLTAVDIATGAIIDQKTVNFTWVCYSD